jgi:hypothetical protein
MKLWPQANRVTTQYPRRQEEFVANLMKHLVGSDYANLVMGLD